MPLSVLPQNEVLDILEKKDLTLKEGDNSWKFDKAEQLDYYNSDCDCFP